jgi:hypothetical protein
MAVSKTIIENRRQRTIVHLIGTAGGDTTSIALTELISSDETTSGTLRVNITAAYCNVTDATSGIVISRGTQEVLRMHGVSEFPMANNLPSLAMSNNSSITVTFHQPGTCILDLRKMTGYVEPQTNVGV